MWKPIAEYGIPSTVGKPPIKADLGIFLVFDPKFNGEDDSGAFVAYYSEKDGEWLSLETGLKLSPTHFMPLPSDPQEPKNES